MADGDPYVAPELADGYPYPAAMWQEALDEIARLSARSLSSPAWQDLTLENGWTNRSSEWRASCFCLIPAPLNSVQVYLAVANGTTAGGTTIATLPPGYRPTYRIDVPVTGKASDATLTPTLQILPTGEMQIWYVQPGDFVQGSFLIPLNL
jgi:hypothetical protein